MSTDAPPAYQPEAFSDQNGNTMQPYASAPQEEVVVIPQRQVVVVVPQPVPQQQVVYVDENGNVMQNIPLQVMNNGEYKAQDGEQTITNLDELPPNYEDIINGTYDQQLNPKDGIGLTRGCAEHKKSWCCSVVLWTFILYVLIVFAVLQLRIWDVFGSFVAFVSISFFVYPFYTLEWLCGSSVKYLRNIYDKDFVYQDVQRLHAETPLIVWRVECFHYVTVRDSKGRSRRKKVVTHRANMNYAFNSWRDVSVPLTGLEEWKMTKLEMYKTFSFGNAHTESDYNDKSQAFRDANNRDRYQRFTVVMQLTDFMPKILVEATPGQRSVCLNRNTYCVFSCLLCSACYKTWFSANTGKKHYIIQKEISL